MPDLLDRILGYLEPDESTLSVSYTSFLAALREIQRGELTQQQVVDALALTPADLAGALVVYNAIFVAGTLPVEEFVDLMVLGSTRNRSNPSGANYYSKATVMARLGL